MSFITLTTHFASIPAIKQLQHEAGILQRWAFNRCLKSQYDGQQLNVHINELAKQARSTLSGITKLEAFSIQSNIKVGVWTYLGWLEKQKAAPTRRIRVTFGSKEAFQQYQNHKITKEKYQESRLVPVYIEGESSKPFGNRRIEIDFSKRTVTYYVLKRNMNGKAIESLTLPLGMKRKSIKLLKQAVNSKIPVSIKLTHNSLSLSFDLSKLNKQIKYKPIVGRTFAFDSNPSNFGWSVTDKNNKVIDSGYYVTPIKTAKTNAKQRKHWLNHIAIDMIRIAKHYQCEKVIAESLDNLCYKYSNYWAKAKVAMQLEKHCGLNDIQFQTVNAAYSSKIGNIVHGEQYGDAVGASIELNRRGKYPSGTKLHLRSKEPSIYPSWDGNSLQGQWKTPADSTIPLCWEEYLRTLKKQSPNLYSARVSFDSCNIEYKRYNFISSQSKFQSIRLK